LALIPLNKAFSQPDTYESNGYALLPMRFTPLDDLTVVATNLVGEYVTLSRADLGRLAGRTLDSSDPLFKKLKSTHFIYDGTSDVACELLATKLRSKHAIFREFTALHIFVVTLRCEHSCSYCQVSRVTDDKTKFDMSRDTADRAIDFMFKSPSPVLKVEFQGGESLLNFDLITHIVESCRTRGDARPLEFVIATNLSIVTDEMLAFCRQHDVLISTSLDGPPTLHNKNRKHQGGDSHSRSIDGIRKAREVLGPHAVSALMTTTADSLVMPREIVDEYLSQGFRSIFLRPINPYGFAVRSEDRIGYTPEQFVEFYKTALDYILELNRQGVPFREDFASIVLTKALSPHGTGYVDLQSPAGIGMKVLVYNYDGFVYASDESRMLAEMGDFRFRLGNLNLQSYEEVFLDSDILAIVRDTMVEGVPQCADCAFMTWCGTDPVRHHRTQGDIVGHRPTSEFCHRNMEIMKHLVRLLDQGGETDRVLRSWVRW